MSRPKGSKNKAKTIIANLQNERKFIADIKAFCKAKGFPPSELIEKFEGLERELAKPLTERNREQWHDLLTEGENKPIPAPKTEQFRMGPPKEEKGKEGAENGAGKKEGKGMPAGLSKTDMLKWHRNHK